MLFQRVNVYAVLVVILLITFISYYPGLSGDFEFDDSLNILQNNKIAINHLDSTGLGQALFSGFSGPLQRPVSMLSFALNHYATGFEPYFFKLTNVAIHLLNGIGIFVLSCLLLSVYQKRFQPDLTQRHIQWISLVITAAWLLHPLNLTSVLYIVQRMTSLATLFTLGGLIFYLWGRLRLCDGKSGTPLILISLLVFGSLAILSKENGALLPLFMLVIELALFRFETAKRSTRLFLISFFSLTVVLPTLSFSIFLMVQPEWLLNGYNIRDFTLPERLMTEARILWFYLQVIMFPNNSQLGIYHDDIPLSHGLLQPISTLFSVLGVVVLLIVAIIARKRAPIIAFGLLFFMVGHSMESTIFPLEIAHEHRNYLAIYGILLIIFYYLLYPLIHSESLRFRYSLAALLIALLGFNTTVRAAYWGDLAEHSLMEVEHHPGSPRANYQLGRVYWMIMEGDPTNKEKYYALAHHHFERAAFLQSNDTSGLIALIRLNHLVGKLTEPEWLVLLKQRLRYMPFASSNVSSLTGLSECQMDKRCHLSQGDMDGIFQAALGNPTLSGSARAIVLAATATDLLMRQDIARALELAQQAVEANPKDLQLRLNLVHLLIAMGRLEMAQAQLDLITYLNLNIKQRQRSQIESARKTIIEMQNGRKEAPSSNLNNQQI